MTSLSEDLSTPLAYWWQSDRCVIVNGASQNVFGQYASQKLLPNQILSYFDVISYCEKKLGTHVSNFFDGVSKEV